MCGILGLLPACEESLFKSSLDRIQHRGPDGYGIWHSDDGRVSLGHRRLAILDLSENGRQPMEWAGRYYITFNGEIYNFIELRTELQKKGIHFRTQSDTEVLLALYATEGEKCLNRLNGMWAFAIYDKVEKTLFMSRDRMGKKPLFYHQKGKTFAFASEMKALYPILGTVDINGALVVKAKKDVFCYEATAECLVEGIKRFPAASYGWLKDGQLTIHTFWNPEEHLIDTPSGYRDQVDMFRELFIDSCKIRMRSDVPVGTALSGGVDSSATISTMSYVAKNLDGIYSRDWQHAFVASFPGSAIDETKEAKKVVDNLGISATYLAIDPLKDIDNIFHYSYLFEDLYLTSPIPMIQLYGKIKQSGTTVTLDGHGSDEIFGGYPWDIDAKIKDDYPSLFRMRQTMQTISDCRNENQHIALKQAYPIFKSDSKKLLKDFLRGRKTESRHALDHLNTKLYQSTFKTILPTLLRNYDRYAMINGVEIRMPFLDHRIVSFAFSIPSTSKIRNGYTKAIVRDALKGFFPDEIRLLKRKIGFNSPFKEWLQGPLKPWALDMISSGSFKTARFIDAEAVQKQIIAVIENPLATYIDGEQAWTALMPYIWEQSFRYVK
jgi:asparagine synthase (glutamine-hydrolysing)